MYGGVVFEYISFCKINELENSFDKKIENENMRPTLLHNRFLKDLQKKCCYIIHRSAYNCYYFRI